MHNKHSLPGELEIPMESFARAVEIMLKRSMEGDGVNQRPDPTLWSVAVQACGYVQARQAISTTVSPEKSKRAPAFA